MQFSPGIYRYPSLRSSLYASRGMVCASTPQAAQAGLSILHKGGNAIDAAVAAAATLPVVEPTGNGIGGDAFALIWSGGRLYGLNASGPAPGGLTADMIRAMGHTEMPKYGWLPVTVPGAPAAWAALSRRFGRLPLTETMAPAIAYAEEGYPLSTVVGKLWRRAWDNFSHVLEGELFSHWFEHFSLNGRPPEVGEIWRSPHMARTLRSIAETDGRSFYEGELAERIIAFARSTGGYLSADDLAAFSSEWVEPISVRYRGYDVWEIPPNGHGIAALMALNILDGLELNPERETARNYHLMIEAVKLALTDAKKYVADPAYMTVTPAELLSPAYAEDRRRLIGERALLPEPGRPGAGGTVYLCTADQEGNMVSYIQSNYMGFGSGLVVPETGIALHNRGNNFSLSEDDPNCYGPGKRPYHTIIPGFLTHQGRPVGPFGVMGGFMQPQAHVQVVCNTLDFALNPQDTLNAPRWQWTQGRKIDVEMSVPGHILQNLLARGHDLNVLVDPGPVGKGQIIWRMDNGVLCGGTEPRTDGTVAVY
jgi:gamma-glutamyltranspeptidase/glutathione hydrolase